ncbi:hypothetical protein CROQUDRAFT_666602 [Cronartium quercuum f. sp. fusiforme G11]|uniref:Uncharacterized protein n=1 Tax=Cronartium quercuum f. sp. fusiforme G11 TaxID=708437 RepID=A0A9P6N5R2_9BASI|nr:hypothetical protein CROQUDRAFT_666602 [Cronartium quercuum f. sp. fusiforme G11]
MLFMVPLSKSLGCSLPTRNFQSDPWHLNPIEQGFHCIKQALKHEQGWNVVEDKADYLLHVAGCVLTQGLMHPLFVSSGYATTHTWENLDEHN